MKHLTTIIATLSLTIAVTCASASVPTGNTPRPTGLMTDLVSNAGCLYRNGHPTAQQMTSLSPEEFASYQYAAIRSSRPTFGWIVPDCGRVTRQRAYRITVDDNMADAQAHKGRVWDSGIQRDDQSVAVNYGGSDLQADKLYFWSVFVETDKAADGEWSLVEPFRTASTLAPYAPSFRPQMIECDKAECITRLDSSTTLIDFGRASFASLELTLHSADDGRQIFVAIGEAIKAGRIDATPHGTIRYYRYPLTLNKGTHTYRIIPAHDKRNTGPQAVLMPEYIGEVAPFRYCQIESYTDDITASDATRLTAVYPFDDNASHFSSDNPTLNAVWDLCKYSIKATSALGIYIDGDRERIPYEADALINQLGHYGVDREYAMARRSSEYLLQYPTWPTEWILQALIIAWNDYLYTGDVRSIEANYATLKARTLQSLRKQNGLISTTADDTIQSEEFRRSINFNGNITDIVDWPRGSEDDHFVFKPYNAVVNAFHYQAMRLLARMAEVTNRRQEARDIDEQCDALRDTYNAAFFDTKAGTYRDGIDTDHHSLHAAIFAMACGLVPEENMASVCDYIRSRDMACSVYASQFLMDALYDSGEADYALHMLTKQDKRSWYNMIAAGTTICFEAWDNAFKPNQDWNHAWGAAPANIIPRRLAGVEPLEAGCRAIRIKPQTSTLRHITAAVPTIRGEVKVDADNTEGCYRLHVVIPTNTSAHIILPVKAKKYTLTRNGRPCRARTDADGKSIDAGIVGSGDYVFVLKY